MFGWGQQQQIPERVAAAANLARRIALLPPHERVALPASPARPAGEGHGQECQPARPWGARAEDLDERYYEEKFDPIRLLLEQLPEDDSSLQYLGIQSGKKLVQLDAITERLSLQVMEHHEEMVKGMQLVTELEKDLAVLNIICRNGKRHLSLAMEEVKLDLLVTANVRRKQILLDMVPVLERMHSTLEMKSRLEGALEDDNFARALRMCSDCLIMIDECKELTAAQDINNSIEEWLAKTVDRIDAVLWEVCRRFDSKQYSTVIDAYAVMDDGATLAEKVLTYFSQAVVSETLDVLKSFLYQTTPGDPQQVKKASRLPFNELCSQLPESAFRQCLHKTLEVLCDLMFAYHTMMAWQHPKVVEVASVSKDHLNGHHLSSAFKQSPYAQTPDKPLWPHQGPPPTLLGTPAIVQRRQQMSPSLSSPKTPFTLARTNSSNLSLSAPSSFENLLSPSGTGSGPEGKPSDDKLSIVKASGQLTRSESLRRGGGSPRDERIGSPRCLPRVRSHERVEASRPGSPLCEDQEVSSDLGLGLVVVTPHEGGEARLVEDIPASLANRMRAETTTAVRRGLEKGRKAIWELAAGRVSALLSADAMASTSAQHFLQGLEFTNRFIVVGEAFSGAEAVGLRAKQAKQSEKYFTAFHRQNLEAMRVMLERESWQRLQPAALSTLNLAGLTGNGAPAFGTSFPSHSHGPRGAATPFVTSPSSGMGWGSFSEDTKRQEPMSSFSDWMAAGNPFADHGQRIPSTPHKEDAVPNGRGHRPGHVGPNEAQWHSSQHSSPSSPASWPRSHNSVALGAALAEAEGVGDDNDEEEEDEELLADFIDEESQKPSSHTISRSRSAVGGDRNRGTQSSDAEAVSNGPSITGAAVSAVRLMDRYARLMQILQPIAPEVFKGLCQLFDLYLLTVFRVFGQRDIFSPHRGPLFSPVSALLTPRLRATLVRISQGLEEHRLKVPSQQHSIHSGAGTMMSPGGSQSGDATSTPVTAAGPNQTVSSSNLYGLRERVVATESAAWLAKMMQSCRSRFQGLLPPSALPFFDHFYARTVEAVPDLREHVFKNLARLLLNLSSHVDKIAASRWELREVGTENNPYVDALLGEFRLFRHRLLHSGVSKQVQEEVMLHGVDVLAEVLVEGFSRIKRCTNEGRALMTLDLQVLLNGLSPFFPAKSKPTMQIVENYVKAYYLPETEYVHWARTHSEYTRSQLVAMINLVAVTNNWKRKTKSDILEKVESGEI